LETLQKLIHQNTAMAVAVAAVAILIAGFILKKIRSLAIVLILIASVIIYILLRTGAIKPGDIENVKEKTKDRVMDNITK
jgi:hypothetical protein